MHEAPSQPVSEETIARGHEADEVGLRGFLIFLGVFTGVGIVVFAIVWAMMIGFEAMGKKGDIDPSPLAKEQVVPPEPWLQPSKPQGAVAATDVEDLKRLREHEDQVLNTYAIESENGNRARIPIDRAMQLLVERSGSATRPSSATPSTQPTTKRTGTPEATGGVR